MDKTYPLPTESGLTKLQVEDLAESVARQLEFRVGDDIEPVVAKLGGRIQFEDDGAEETAESGSLYVNSMGDFDILVSKFTSHERDRFTIAHELGHYVLHFLYPRNNGANLESLRATRYGSTRIEWEANWFAAAFLMPHEQFVAAWSQVKNPSSLAIQFRVSQSAAEVRARRLGLIA